MDLHVASSKEEITLSYVLKGSYHSEWDCEMESLQRHIRDLELEIRRRYRKRTPKGSSRNHDSERSIQGAHLIMAILGY